MKLNKQMLEMVKDTERGISKKDHLKGLLGTDKDIVKNKDLALKFRKQSEKVNDLGEHISKKYYGGDSVSDGASRTFTAISGIGTAALGGVMNSASANAQYGAAQKQKKQMLDKKASEYEEQIYKEAREYIELCSC